VYKVIRNVWFQPAFGGKPEVRVSPTACQTRVLFPFVFFFYCLFVKGGIGDGRGGTEYTEVKPMIAIAKKAKAFGGI